MKRAILSAGVLLLVTALPLPARAADDDLAPKLRAALVRLHVTSQTWENASPWQLNEERTREGRGVVVKPGLILTKSSNVADHRLIEVSVANSARRYAARLSHVDKRLGLALVECKDAELAKVLAPLPLGKPVGLDDEFDIHQLGNDNVPERYKANVIRASAGPAGLSLLLKTTCSDTGDGQVALKDGRIVGLVTSTFGSRQQATILSLETVRRYLADFDDGVYQGLPDMGFWTQPLLRADLRTFYGLAPEQHGLAVSRTVEGHTGHGVLEVGDVILAMEGYDLDDEGTFVHERHGRLHSSYLSSGRRHAGDTIRVLVLRGGAKVGLKVPLLGQAPEDKRIPDGYDDGRPQYMVVAGLVLLELTSNSSISRSPGGVILRRYRERSNWDPPSERKRIIYADRLLQDPATKGYEDIHQLPLASINGRAIHAFGDVGKALETPEGDYHVFRFEGLESDFVIAADQRETIDARIAERYKIRSLRHVDADGP